MRQAMQDSIGQNHVTAAGQWPLSLTCVQQPAVPLATFPDHAHSSDRIDQELHSSNKASALRVETQTPSPAAHQQLDISKLHTAARRNVGLGEQE